MKTYDGPNPPPMTADKAKGRLILFLTIEFVLFATIVVLGLIYGAAGAIVSILLFSIPMIILGTATVVWFSYYKGIPVFNQALDAIQSGILYEDIVQVYSPLPEDLPYTMYVTNNGIVFWRSYVKYDKKTESSWVKVAVVPWSDITRIDKISDDRIPLKCKDAAISVTFPSEVTTSISSTTYIIRVGPVIAPIPIKRPKASKRIFREEGHVDRVLAILHLARSRTSS